MNKFKMAQFNLNCYAENYAKCVLNNNHMRASKKKTKKNYISANRLRVIFFSAFFDKCLFVSTAIARWTPFGTSLLFSDMMRVFALSSCSIPFCCAETRDAMVFVVFVCVGCWRPSVLVRLFGLV